jgi:hypothetical protein
LGGERHAREKPQEKRQGRTVCPSGNFRICFHFDEATSTEATSFGCAKLRDHTSGDQPGDCPRSFDFRHDASTSRAYQASSKVKYGLCLGDEDVIICEAATKAFAAIYLIAGLLRFFVQGIVSHFFRTAHDRRRTQCAVIRRRWHCRFTRRIHTPTFLPHPWRGHRRGSIVFCAAVVSRSLLLCVNLLSFFLFSVCAVVMGGPGLSLCVTSYTSASVRENQKRDSFFEVTCRDLSVI